MNARYNGPIMGHKKGSGGGKARTPVEDPDSLVNTEFLRVKDLLSEGEVQGFPSGDPLKDIFLNGTPIKNPDGTVNFPDVQVEYRPGTQNQEPMSGFPSSERIVPSGVALEYGLPVTQQFTNTNVSAIRINMGVNSLLKRDENTGDTTGYYVEYAVDMAMDGGPFNQLFVGAFSGKNTSGYVRSHVIDLPRAFVSWTLRIRRLTPQSTSTLIQDSTFIQNFVEVIYSRLRHPMSAMAGMLIDARTFQSPPTRAYRMLGRIIEVPSNYDAINRTYTGTWDGTFKLSWTNNPAWIFRDLVTNARYGTGDKVDKSVVNIYALYRIAQYCDELVPDGQGGSGTEPRFTCNVYIQTAQQAMKVIQSLASIFRGAAYWAASSVVAVADMPTDDLYTFTNANVIGGRFTRVGSARTTRYTVCLVSYSDQNDFGRQKTIAVEDEEGTSRYGLKQTEITVFGCTSPGQAYRAGQWLLLSSQIETDAVTFKVSLERVLVMPGRVVKIADKHRAGRRIGGRISSATANQIVMDGMLGVRPGDRITVNLPSGICETRTVVGEPGNVISADRTDITADRTDITADMVGLPGETRIVNVSQPFSETPEPEAQWALESEDLNVQRYRILTVDYKDNLEAEVSAIQHEPGKYTAIDYNTRLSTAPVSIIPSIAQKAPTNLRIVQEVMVDQNMASTRAVFMWDRPENGIEYAVEWTRDNSDWIKTQGSTTTRFEVPNAYAGVYKFRVRAIGGTGASSAWAYSQPQMIDGIIGDPPQLATLTTITQVFGIGVRWTFKDTPAPIGLTEIWYSRSNDLNTAIKVGDFAYPQDNHLLMGLQSATVFFFWGRVRDKNGLPGAFYPGVNQGVIGTTSVNAQEYLDYFAGLIGDDQLANGLRTKIDDLEVGVGDVTTKIEQEKTLREDADEVLAQTIDTVSARSDTALGEAQAAAASVVNERNARINADEILASDVSTVRAATESQASQITTERQARIDGDGALASSIETVRATANGASAGVQTNSTAIAGIDGGLRASYTIRAQVNQFGQVYAAGMTLGAYDTGQGVQTAVYFLANRFALLDETNGQLTVPFIIENGTTYIGRALIGDAWITNAKIANAAIDNAKIASLSADKVTFGQMSGDRIEAYSMAANLLNVDTAWIKRAHIQELAVDTFRIADNAATVAAAFVVNRSFSNGTGDNLLQFPVYLPVPSTVYVIMDLVMTGGSPESQNVYFGANIGITGQASLPMPTNDKFAKTRIVIAEGKPSGSVALHISCDRPSGGTRFVSGNVIIVAVMK